MEEKKVLTAKQDGSLDSGSPKPDFESKQPDSGIQQPDSENQQPDSRTEFAKKLKLYRMNLKMSQADFAKFVGIPARTYQNYESGHRYPKNMEVVNKIAVALNVTAEDLLGPAGGYIVEAGEKGNSRDQRRMEQIVTQLSAMFAGGDIDEESKDAAMAALNEVYWRHKRENQEKYTPKRYRTKKESGGENSAEPQDL